MRERVRQDRRAARATRRAPGESAAAGADAATTRLIPFTALHRSIGNRASSRLLGGRGSSALIAQRAGLNSNKIALVATGANVAKAPNNFSAARFRTRAEAIDGIDIGDVVGEAGSLAGEDVDGGIRVDLQGDFEEGGVDFQNVQAQANDPVNDLTYPVGTPGPQRGTSVAAVYVESQLPASDKPDVRNRTLRLLKQGIYASMGDRNTYPRPAFKVVYED